MRRILLGLTVLAGMASGSLEAKAGTLDLSNLPSPDQFSTNGGTAVTVDGLSFIGFAITPTGLVYTGYAGPETGNVLEAHPLAAFSVTYDLYHPSTASESILVESTVNGIYQQKKYLLLGDTLTPMTFQSDTNGGVLDGFILGVGDEITSVSGSTIPDYVAISNLTDPAADVPEGSTLVLTVLSVAVLGGGLALRRPTRANEGNIYA